MPGEVAKPHRHTASAMRMVIESAGAHSEVDGEPVDMRPGDLILNQSWHWHGHANEGTGPHISMTCLDMPLTRFLGPLFAEPYGADSVPGGRPEGDGLARFGTNMRQMGSAGEAVVSPISRYPYDRTRDALAHMERAGAFDSCHGIKMEYINPVTGGPVLPTLSAYMQLLPAGFSGETYRSTAAWVYHAVEGAGRTTIGDTTIEWGHRDIFVVPAWYPHRHEATGESVLYSFSDRGVHQKLGVFRELRGAAAESVVPTP
jgi:gentisate 1,2-dioxygenase